MVEHAFADQPVVKDHVGGFERAPPSWSRKLGIAGTGADQKHAAALSRRLGGLGDRRLNQIAGLVLIALEHGFGGGPSNTASQNFRRG